MVEVYPGLAVIVYRYLLGRRVGRPGRAVDGTDGTGGY